MFLFCFRRAHTLTVLFVLVSVLIYVAVFEPVWDDTSYNTKRYGHILCILSPEMMTEAEIKLSATDVNRQFYMHIKHKQN